MGALVLRKAEGIGGWHELLASCRAVEYRPGVGQGLYARHLHSHLPRTTRRLRHTPSVFLSFPFQTPIPFLKANPNGRMELALTPAAQHSSAMPGAEIELSDCELQPNLSTVASAQNPLTLIAPPSPPTHPTQASLFFQ